MKPSFVGPQNSSLFRPKDTEYQPPNMSQMTGSSDASNKLASGKRSKGIVGGGGLVLSRLGK